MPAKDDNVSTGRVCESTQACWQDFKFRRREVSQNALIRAGQMGWRYPWVGVILAIAVASKSKPRVWTQVCLGQTVAACSDGMRHGDETGRRQGDETGTRQGDRD